MNDLDVRTDDEGITRVTLSRPERHNALDRSLIDHLHDTLARLDSNTRVLVLAGRGKSFCAGADIDWMLDSAALSAEENAADALALSALLETLDTLPCPTIARVHGAAIGGGAGLVACCDIAVADEDTRFAFSEVRVGVIPAMISPYVIRAVGPSTARRWFLSGEPFSALEAYHTGLVHDFCSPQDLDRNVHGRLKALLAGGTAAQCAIKKLVQDVTGRPVDTTLQRDLAQRLAEVRAGREAREGLAAFQERRKPRW